MNPATQTERTLRRAVYSCVCGSVLLALGLSYTRAGKWLEDGTFDVRARWTAQRGKADPRVVIVDVDNASYSVLQEKLGRWPWPRTVWTEVIRYVSKGQPSAIAVDIVFGGEDKSGGKVDAEFANVLRTSGKTALAFAFLSTQMSSDDESAEKERERILRQQGMEEGFGPSLTREEWVPNLPLPQLADAAAGLGSINSTPDQTGTIRRTPLQFRFGDRGYLTLSARAVQIVSGPSSGLAWHQRAGMFDHNFVTRGDHQIPLDDEGKLVLLYRGDSLHAFPRVPIWEVICSIYREQCPNAEHFYAADYFRD